MQPVMSIFVDAIMAGLMIALIVYCVRLNRRLAALRDNDADIRRMIVELRNAADRADAATHVLKSAGVEAEQSLRAEVLRAEAARDALGAAVRAHAGTPPRARRQSAHVPSARSGGASAAGDPFDDGFYPRAAPPGAASAVPGDAPATRHAAEKELLKAIRSARAGG